MDSPPPLLLLTLLLTLLHFCASAALPCGPGDYFRVQTAGCDGEHRSVELRKRPDAVCEAETDVNKLRFQTSCECTLDDYVLDVGTCAPGQLKTTFNSIVKKGDCNGGITFQQAAATEIPCPCTYEDYLHTAVSDCTPHNKRYLTYYFEEGCTPVQNYPLPAPKRVPCDEVCDSGSFLGFDWSKCSANRINDCDATCQTCPAGRYSFNGERYDNFTTWPTAWDTGCDGGTYCSGWGLGPESLYSGNQWGSDSIRSWLSTRVQVKNPRDAKLSFEYRVESEKTWSEWLDDWMGDGLTLEINGAFTPIVEDMEFIGGKMYSFNQSREIPLPVPENGGPTEIKFVYSKDSGDTKYQDAAWIKNIRITGTKQFADSCKLCPPGSYQDDPQSNECDSCAQDTYSNSPGMTQCLPCGDQQWAPAGSTSCQLKKTCDAAADFVPIRSCVNGKQAVTQLQINPHCISSNVNAAAPDGACDPCSPGFTADGTGSGLRVCKPCAEGSMSSDGVTCTVCPAGAFAQKVIRYTTFEAIAPVKLSGQVSGSYGETWRTSCTGLCSDPVASAIISKGWIVIPMKKDGKDIVVMNSGLFHGTSFKSVLSVEVKLHSAGRVTFSYGSFSRSGPVPWYIKMVMAFLVDNGDEVIPHELEKSEDQSFALDLAAGTYTLSWMFETMNQEEDNLGVSYSMWDLTIEGAQEGAAPQCLDCPPGHYCPPGSSTPIVCPAKSISTGKAAQCEKCPDGTVSPPGVNECRYCAPDSRASEDGEWCVPGCSLSFHHQDKYWDYDLLELDHGLQVIPAERCGPNSNFDDPECSREYNFTIKFCSAGEDDPKNVDCPGDGLSYTHSLACQKKRGYIWPIGSNRTVHFSDSLQRWTVNFDGGKYCSSASHDRRTKIDMICDPDVDFKHPKLYQKGEGPACVYNFEFHGPQACPICTIDDYHVEAQDCVLGLQTMKKVRKGNCSDIQVQDKVRTCPRCDFIEYEICDERFRRWHRTVYESNSSCWTPLLSSKTDFIIGHCAQINVDEANWFTIGGVVMLMVGWILLAGIIIVCVKHRRLRTAYGNLFNSRNREMTAYNVPCLADENDPVFGDDVDDDDNIAATADDELDQRL